MQDLSSSMEDDDGINRFEEMLNKSRGNSSQNDSIKDISPNEIRRGIRSIESPSIFNNLPNKARPGRETALTMDRGSRSTVASSTLVSEGANRPLSLSMRSLSRERPKLIQPPEIMTVPHNNNLEQKETSSKFTAKPIEISIDPTSKPPDLATESNNSFQVVLPKSLPSWFMITYAYSFVLILILMIANVTPDGKLYIHFTAFWSLVLYLVLDEDQQGEDPIDTVFEGFVK